MRYRLDQLAEQLADINEHGTKPELARGIQMAQLAESMTRLEKAVADIPLMRQEMTRAADSWVAMRNALYGLAATIIAAAILVVILGHK